MSHANLLKLVVSEHRRRVVDYRLPAVVFAHVTTLTRMRVGFDCCVESTFVTYPEIPMDDHRLYH